MKIATPALILSTKHPAGTMLKHHHKSAQTAAAAAAQRQEQPQTLASRVTTTTRRDTLKSAGVAVLSSSLLLPAQRSSAAATAPPTPPTKPFCAVVDNVPSWAYNTPWQASRRCVAGVSSRLSSCSCYHTAQPHTPHLPTNQRWRWNRLCWRLLLLTARLQHTHTLMCPAILLVPNTPPPTHTINTGRLG